MHFIGVIFCFGLESAFACASDEALVKESSSSKYKVGTCLGKKTSITLKKVVKPIASKT